MKEQMKKIELLLFHREGEQFLKDLRRAGVVHIDTDKADLSQRGESLRSELIRVDRILRDLGRLKIEEKTGSTQDDAAKLIDETEEINRQYESCSTEIATLQKDALQLKHWGDFDPALLDQLEERSVYTFFFDVPAKDMDSLDGQTYAVIQDMGASKYVVVFSRKETINLPYLEPLAVPRLSLKEVKAKIEDLAQKRQKLMARKKEIAARAQIIRAYGTGLENDLRYEQTQSSMQGLTAGRILHLTGWIPHSALPTVESLLENYSCWYETADPQREDRVPVKMKNPGGFKLFEPITKIFDLPDYFELDPTPFFAPFYALFFGLCLGDIGYGAVLLVLSLAAGAKMKKSLKPIFNLGAVLGLMTMLSGVLLNTFFGAPLFPGGQEQALLSSGGGFALLQNTVVDGKTVYPAMAFSVYLGIIQIILGMLLKSWNRYHAGGPLHAVFPFGTIALTAATVLALIKINFLDMATFFQVVSGGDISAAAVMSALSWTTVQVMGGIGLALLFLFNNPDKNVGIRLPLGLWELYQFVTGIMGDGLSYIRLFALGLAGGLLGNAFNQIAFMVSGDDKPAILFAATILILILGHTINFILAGLGAFVHPLRLTFVEFYNNLEFKGGAIPFSPFKKLENPK
ncbi:MAG: V-type ATP synthase subunit I [Fibrobacterota bacterium]